MRNFKRQSSPLQRSRGATKLALVSGEEGVEGEALTRGAGEVEALRSLPGEELPCQTGGGEVHLTGVTKM